jgi:RimJ/RimL family protein N-acetyltransferase
LTPSVIATLDEFLIRSLVDTDAVAIADLWSDPRAMRFMVGPRSHGLIRAAFAELARLGLSAEERWWVVEDRTSGAFVGQCGLCPKELEGRVETELVYLVVPSRWGQGIASASAAAVVRHAREVIGLERLIALIEVGNLASEVVAMRSGFHYTNDLVRPDGRILRVYTLELSSRHAA